MNPAFLALTAANPGLLLLTAGPVDLLAAAGITVTPSDPPKPPGPRVGLPATPAPAAATSAEADRRFLASLQRDAAGRAAAVRALLWGQP